MTMDAVEMLAAGGYPAEVNCVLCGFPTEGLDWWHLGDVVGPCCGMRRGCEQTGHRKLAS